jgi:hypothetical protein
MLSNFKINNLDTDNYKLENQVLYNSGNVYTFNYDKVQIYEWIKLWHWEYKTFSNNIIYNNTNILFFENWNIYKFEWLDIKWKLKYFEYDNKLINDDQNIYEIKKWNIKKFNIIRNNRSRINNNWFYNNDNLYYIDLYGSLHSNEKVKILSISINNENFDSVEVGYDSLYNKKSWVYYLFKDWKIYSKKLEYNKEDLIKVIDGKIVQLKKLYKDSIWYYNKEKLYILKWEHSIKLWDIDIFSYIILKPKYLNKYLYYKNHANWIYSKTERKLIWYFKEWIKVFENIDIDIETITYLTWSDLIDKNYWYTDKGKVKHWEIIFLIKSFTNYWGKPGMWWWDLSFDVKYIKPWIKILILFVFLITILLLPKIYINKNPESRFATIYKPKVSKIKHFIFGLNLILSLYISIICIISIIIIWIKQNLSIRELISWLFSKSKLIEYSIYKFDNIKIIDFDANTIYISTLIILNIIWIIYYIKKKWNKFKNIFIFLSILVIVILLYLLFIIQFEFSRFRIF